MTVEPIGFRILKDLQESLKAIRRADGYWFDVTAFAVKLDPNTDVEALMAPTGPRPFMILELANDTRRHDPADQLRIKQPVRIHWVHDIDPRDDDTRMRTFWRACADVETAIRPAGDGSRGGLAMETIITSQTFTDYADSTQVWAITNVEITYYRTFGYPNAHP